MGNGLGVDSHFPNLSDRPGIVCTGDGVIQEEFRFPFGGIFLERQSYDRAQKDPFGPAFGNDHGALFQSVLATKSGRNNDRPSLPDFGGLLFHPSNLLFLSEYQIIRKSAIAISGRSTERGYRPSFYASRHWICRGREMVLHPIRKEKLDFGNPRVYGKHRLCQKETRKSRERKATKPFSHFP
jgi:hypothetical protein